MNDGGMKDAGGFLSSPQRGKTDRVYFQAQRSALEIRRRASQNKTVSERRSGDIFSSAFSAAAQLGRGSEATALNADRDALKFMNEACVTQIHLLNCIRAA